MQTPHTHVTMNPSGEVNAALAPPPMPPAGADEATVRHYYTVALPAYATRLLTATAKAVTFLENLESQYANRSREAQDLEAKATRLRQELSMYGYAQTNADLERRIEEERTARVNAEVAYNAAKTDAQEQINRAKAEAEEARKAVDATLSAGYESLIRQRVLDAGSFRSPRHAQIVSELAAARRREILRLFEAAALALSAESLKAPASRDDYQVAALCNSMSGILGGARIPSDPAFLVYRFETGEDAQLFRDTVIVTGANIEIALATNAKVKEGAPPAFVVMKNWQKK